MLNLESDPADLKRAEAFVRGLTSAELAQASISPMMAVGRLDGFTIHHVNTRGAQVLAELAKTEMARRPAARALRVSAWALFIAAISLVATVAKIVHDWLRV